MYRERFISGYTNIPDIYGYLSTHTPFPNITNHHKICVELSYRKRWYWLKLHQWAVPASMLPRDPMHRWPVHNPWSERSNESPAGFFLTTFPTLADVGGWTHQPNLKNMQPSNRIMKPPSFGMKIKTCWSPPPQNGNEGMKKNLLKTGVQLGFIPFIPWCETSQWKKTLYSSLVENSYRNFGVPKFLGNILWQKSFSANNHQTRACWVIVCRWSFFTQISPASLPKFHHRITASPSRWWFSNSKCDFDFHLKKMARLHIKK